MVQDSSLLPPPVIWAQRPSIIFLTICLEDCKNPEIKLDSDKLYFKGVGGTEMKMHEVTIPFCKEIDPEKSATAVKARNIEFILKKKDSSVGYWPQLCPDKQKRHWLKVDFNKWQDEDDSEDETGGQEDLEEMRQMGGFGDGGAKPNFDDLDGESDSDDEELPDLE